MQKRLISIFEHYGLPERMMMDNSSPWGDTIGTALKLWLMRHGIQMGDSRPYHPQTQGRLERFHRSLKAEVLQSKWLGDSGELLRVFDHWRAVYNRERPYGALDKVVLSCYHSSARQYRGSNTSPEYGEGMMVRKVDTSGKLNVKASP